MSLGIMFIISDDAICWSFAINFMLFSLLYSLPAIWAIFDIQEMIHLSSFIISSYKIFLRERLLMWNPVATGFNKPIPNCGFKDGAYAVIHFFLLFFVSLGFISLSSRVVSDFFGRLICLPQHIYSSLYLVPPKMDTIFFL